MGSQVRAQAGQLSDLPKSHLKILKNILLKVEDLAQAEEKACLRARALSRIDRNITASESFQERTHLKKNRQGELRSEPCVKRKKDLSEKESFAISNQPNGNGSEGKCLKCCKSLP